MATHFGWAHTPRFFRSWERQEDIVEEMRPHVIPLDEEAELFIRVQCMTPIRSSTLDRTYFSEFYTGGCGGTFMPATGRVVPSLRFQSVGEPWVVDVLESVERSFEEWRCAGE